MGNSQPVQVTKNEKKTYSEENNKGIEDQPFDKEISVRGNQGPNQPSRREHRQSEMKRMKTEFNEERFPIFLGFLAPDPRTICLCISKIFKNSHQ